MQEQFFLGNLFIELEHTCGQTQSLCALASSALVAQVVGAGPYANDSKRRFDAQDLQTLDTMSKISGNRISNWFRFQNAGHTYLSPSNTNT